MSKPSEHRSIARNRKARHTYFVLEELECGIQLRGTEVKSLRDGQCSIGEAYVYSKHGELFLLGSHIPEYSHGTNSNHKPTRERKLLLHKRELLKWAKKASEQGVTMVPLEVYFSGSLVKVLVGLCKGKKVYDKRAVERERSDKRDMDRAMHRRR